MPWHRPARRAGAQRRAARALLPEAALLLLERGADWKQGKSVDGLPFRNLIDSYAGSQGDDSDFVAVRQFLQQH